MAERSVIALDVGGTTIDAACVSSSGDMVAGLPESDSPADGGKDEIVNRLAGIVDAARARAAGTDVTACGVAMPGPFDYVAGVSRMTHKFQGIHGVPLGELLAEKTGLATCFINDADAFGLGVSWRQRPDAKRLIALTIGTGLGGSFIENGDSLVADDRVPPGGEIWDLPFGDGILEDFVSARGVAAAFCRLRPGEPRSAKDIADLARLGDRAAVEAYQALGAALGSGLAGLVLRFAPEVIAVGGKVGQSLGLFGPAMRQALTAAGLPEVPVVQAAPGNMALWGAARAALSA